jgi:hypothetical protein
MIDDGVKGEGVEDDEVKVADMAIHLVDALDARDQATGGAGAGFVAEEDRDVTPTEVT